MNWKLFIVIACAVGSFLCFLPIFTFDLSLGNEGYQSELYRAVLSSDFIYSNIASIAVTLHMIFEILLDYFNYNEISKIGMFPRSLLVLSMLIPNILFIALSFENMLPLFQCIVSARSILRTGIVLVYLDSSGDWFWSNKSTFITFLFYAVSGIIRNMSYFSQHSSPLVAISLTIHIVAILGLIVICISWICKFRYLYGNECNVESICSFIVIFLCCGIFISISILKYYSSFNAWDSMGTTTLTTISYLELLFVVLVTAAHHRFVDNEIMATKQILETKRTFVRFVSHEIRTPLNTVSLGIDLLQSELKKAGNFPELIEITNDLKSSGEIALSLINDLLVYDKLEAGILKLELDHLPIWNLLMESMRPFQLQARQAEIDLILPSPSTSFTLLSCDIEDIITIADKGRIRQVMSNMISNALKFSPKSSNVTVDVVFLPWADEGHILPPSSSSSSPALPDIISTEYKGYQVLKMMLSVIDHGPGLSRENQKKLFKEIIQFNPGKLQGGGGSGLGLWISQRIAIMHGGKLSVASEGEGYGCTFTFTLPVYVKSVTRESSHQGTIGGGGSRFSSHSLDTSGGRGQREQRRRKLASESLMIEVMEVKSDSSDSKLELESSRSLSSATVETLLECQSKESKDVESTLNITTYQNESEMLAADQVIQNLLFLVVDDVPMNRKMICRVLRGKCKGTLEADDGVVAVQLVKQMLLESAHGEGEGVISIDVILMDYVMPIMNGPEATRLIRSLGYTGIIIGVTGNAQPAEIAEFLSAGANRILIKPINLNSIIDNIIDVQLSVV